MSQVEVSRTLDTGRGLSPDKNDGGIAIVEPHRSVVRRLTPVECERLQGFPDDWTEGQADSHRYKQMGNAVTVNVAHYVGHLIMEADK